VPDEVPRPAPAPGDGRPPPTDLIDLLCEFATAFPAWTRGDGQPLSWRHFTYGSTHLHRAHARASLRTSAAVGITHAQREDAEQWYRAQKEAAGW
jgi:hypothetical protein